MRTNLNLKSVIVLVVLVVVAAAVPALAQTHGWVEEAIHLGSTKKVKPYPLQNKFLGVSATLGSVTTPYLRVAIAASEAREKLMPFDTTKVTEEMLADNVVVTVLPILGNRISDTHRSAEHVVIKKPKSKDPADAIQPLSIQPFSEGASNVFGARIEKQGMVATFPTGALREGWVFYLLYEKAPGTRNEFELPITKEMLQQLMIAGTTEK
jgi:hypothetical protein